MIRAGIPHTYATGPLDRREIDTLCRHRARTGHKFVLSCRTYAHWADQPGSPAFDRFAKRRAEQAAAYFNGLGFYSWNEMVDVHVAHSPAMKNTTPGPKANRSAFTKERSERAIKVLQAVTTCYCKRVGSSDG